MTKPKRPKRVRETFETEILDSGWRYDSRLDVRVPIYSLTPNRFELRPPFEVGDRVHVIVERIEPGKGKR